MPRVTLPIRREDGILVATLGSLGDPVRRDALACDLEELSQALLLDAEVRVVVLEYAADGGFQTEDHVCPAPSDEEESLTEEACRSLADPVASLEVPVIAAIPGDALGAGLELALACDLRVSAETTLFGLPQILSGRIPNNGGTQRLLRLVGRGKCLEMVLTRKPIDALDALRIGLVNRIVPPGDVRDTALAMARELAAKAPISLRYTKEAVREGTEMTLSQGLRLESDLYMLLQTTRDREVGIGSALQGRRKKPCFKGC
ncbi:MAG: enoyl-CoA hydratase-related protein [Syntrophaceae bacterium]|nr:enoyl-CoA hydratase-related protein [Syntrophaceae bacterium]